jgi:ribosomal protein S18 acetylase RimI-like enzyme
LAWTIPIFFYAWMEEKFLPNLRLKYPIMDQYASQLEKFFIELIHNDYRSKTLRTDYPSHLHINVLNTHQRKGFGTKLLESFKNELKLTNVKGFYFHTGKSNSTSISFYLNFGCKILQENNESIEFGMKLD